MHRNPTPDDRLISYVVYSPSTGMTLGTNPDDDRGPILTYEDRSHLRFETAAEAVAAAWAWLDRYGDYPVNVDEGLDGLEVVTHYRHADDVRTIAVIRRART